MNSQFAYDKMDYYSVLEYLKQQAKYFSNNVWTDFSDADIGAVLLKLLAMNTDTTNYQVEKGISELYIDTVVERTNAIALCKLIGYEPRHYESAVVNIVVSGTSANQQVLPKQSLFTNNSRDVYYYTLEDYTLNSGDTTVEAYEGTLVNVNRAISDITNTGTIILDDYNIATNTVKVIQGGASFTKVDNALYGDGDACFSVHLNSDNQIYIQLPPYYSNFITNATIEISYLLSSGVEGRVGSGILNGIFSIDGVQYAYNNPEASEGGYNPETVEEIRNEAPRYASTMNTLVTLNDFRILAKDFSGISDVVALDYNYPESGLKQPDGGNVNDAYKVNLYILPEFSDSIYNAEGELDNLVKLYLEDVQLKKPSSITLNYYDVQYIRPHITMRVYMDQYDLRYSTTAESIKNFLVEKYSRYNRKIGQPIFKSHISSEILDEFNYINYLEITYIENEANGALKCNNLQYIDIVFNNITVQTVPYTEEN